MKIRDGFVSNSSSTSFIVKINDTASICCDKCGQYNPGSIFYAIEKNKIGSRDKGLDKITSMRDVISEFPDLDTEEFDYLKKLIEEDDIYLFTIDEHGGLWDILGDSRLEIVFNPEE